MERVKELAKGAAAWVLLTGGEPALQVDRLLVDRLHQEGFKIAVETNGTIKLPDEIDWICVSPKSAAHTIQQRQMNELKYVLAAGQALPDPPMHCDTDHLWVSPAFQPDGTLRRQDLDHCLVLVLGTPGWRLSLQVHKLIKAR